MENKTVKQLQSEQKVLRTQLRKISDEIEQRELKKQLPKLIKQYEGKYWKYLNSTNPETKWFLYSFCRKVIDDSKGLFDCFQLTKANYDNNDFKCNQENYFFLCQTEITKEEYIKELNKFKKEINKLDPI
jgi:hypothetical protein